MLPMTVSLMSAPGTLEPVSRSRTVLLGASTLPVSRIGRMIGASNRLAGMVSVPDVAPV
jgi:hypothetical protein